MISIDTSHKEFTIDDIIDYEEIDYKIESSFHDRFIHEWDKDKNNNINFYTKEKFSKYQPHWICSKCSFSWQKTIYARVNGAGCPECGKDSKIYDMSSSEIICHKVLTELVYNYDINMNYEYSFSLLLDRRFDFKIDNYVIEYDGPQHFNIPDPRFNSKAVYLYLSKWKTQQQSDIEKMKFCIDNKISCLRISYLYRSKKDIRRIILSFLSQLNDEPIYRLSDLKYYDYIINVYPQFILI